MCYMPKLLWPAERQDISLGSGLGPAQTMSKACLGLHAAKHVDEDTHLAQDLESHCYYQLGQAS